MLLTRKRAVNCIIFILIPLLLGGLFYIPVQAVQPNDTKGHWSDQLVCRAASLELISGYPDNSFKPEKEISQMEALVLFMRAAGYNDNKKTVNKKDVKAPIKAPQVSWGQSYMDMAVQNDLLPAGWLSSFNAAAPATRAQVVALICRLLQLPVENEAEVSADSFFSDINQSPAEYIPYIIALSDAGIMNGYEDGTFKPSKSLKRSEAAAILSSLLDESWVNIPSGRRVEGWVQKISTQGNKKELELVSLNAVQIIKLDSSSRFFNDNEECKASEALNYKVEILLNSKKQASCISLLAKKPDTTPGDKLVGSVKSVVMGKDNILVLSDLNNEERHIPIAWSAVLDDGGKGKTKGFNSLKAGTFVQAYVDGGKLIKLSILTPQNISGTVSNLSSKRLSFAGNSSKSSSSSKTTVDDGSSASTKTTKRLKIAKPEWFNYWDRARIVDKSGKSMGSVMRGDKVKITYLDVFPGEIDDEIPLEIMISSRPELKKVKAEVESTKSLEGKYGITVKKNKNYEVDEKVSVYSSVYSSTTFDFIKTGDKVEMQVDGAGVVMKINII
ncbi:MAG: S-layer homology domain-containing protein [Syntrophomonadaceae bacterium]|nr:S-layer homology domain-containing protein [Syntrophomonadaceae bacterium]MDD3022866.1 S-layer homology domain-containing protein [Syntrophomonadaceae bacterium]